MGEDKDFQTLLESWSSDGRHLQGWLQEYERTTLLGNNWGKDEDRVFSEEAAIQVMEFAKVRSSALGQDVISHPFQAQGKLLDHRRRAKFEAKPTGFLKESERLGLFQARLPGFSQLFFHNFSEREVMERQGQSNTGGVVSRRAAEAYLRSGVRLESSCGISNVWYSYVESNARLFGQPTNPRTSSSKAALSGRNAPPNPQTSLTPPPSPVHPCPSPQEMKEIHSLLPWHRAHSRPRPTKIQTGSILPFLRASDHPSLSDSRRERSFGLLRPVGTGDEGRKGKEPVRARGEVLAQRVLPSVEAVANPNGDNYGYEDENLDLGGDFWTVFDSGVNQDMEVEDSEVERVELSRKRARRDSDDGEPPQHPLSLTQPDLLFTAEIIPRLNPTAGDKKVALELLAKRRKAKGRL